MAEQGLLAQNKGNGEDSKLFTRTIVAAGERALYDKELGPQIEQLAMSTNNPVDGVATALTMLLSEIRNQLVQQGKPVPMDLLFVEDGAAEKLADDICELLGIDDDIAEDAAMRAQGMIQETDNQAMQGNAQQQQSMQQQPQQAPQGLLAGGM